MSQRPRNTEEYPDMPRDTYVRIGQAARLAGVSVDTLRRWEADGKLSAQRSLGGQRSYLLADIESLRDGDDDADENGNTPRPLPAPSAPVTAPVQPWKVREANAAADLNVTKLQIDRQEELRRYREADQRRLDLQQKEAETRAIEIRLRAQQEAERRNQQQALDTCLRSVRIGLMFQPPAVCAEAERFLAEQATPGVSLPWIEAEVSAIMDRHRAEREKKAQEERDAATKRSVAAVEKAVNESRRAALLRHGEATAKKLTADREEWDAKAADEAVDEVQLHLDEHVDSTWSEKRVEREVANALAEWE
ncbi:MAG: MerR family DNA-binding transcriptional regulator [Gemmatimonadota bacterium]|nr:MerR family DNA-binding transcriptional regulator [Gemmatimonadota bacterium]